MEIDRECGSRASAPRRSPPFWGSVEIEVSKRCHVTHGEQFDADINRGEFITHSKWCQRPYEYVPLVHLARKAEPHSVCEPS